MKLLVKGDLKGEEYGDGSSNLAVVAVVFVGDGGGTSDPTVISVAALLIIHKKAW